MTRPKQPDPRDTKCDSRRVRYRNAQCRLFRTRKDIAGLQLRKKFIMRKGLAECRPGSAFCHIKRGFEEDEALPIPLEKWQRGSPVGPRSPCRNCYSPRQTNNRSNSSPSGQSSRLQIGRFAQHDEAFPGYPLPPCCAFIRPSGALGAPVGDLCRVGPIDRGGIMPDR